MELASMLAGEPFSDHPDSVCPTIAGFLRAYNEFVVLIRLRCSEGQRRCATKASRSRSITAIADG